MQPIHRDAVSEQARLYAVAAGLFLLCSLALAFPWLCGRVTIPWDAKAHFQPQFAFLAHALHSGQSPFWTPNVFAGMPQIADPQSLIFSPFFLVAAALVPEPSFGWRTALVFAMLAMGGLALIGYFRDRGWQRRRRADRRARFRLRRLGGVAHPAHRADHEPRLASR